jgi:acetyl-CoA C-acetyltransferase
MPEAYIVEAVRTPVGKKNGGLAAAHPADLGAHVLKELLGRADLDPAAVDDVVFGCLDTLGPQAGDIARTSWLAAGLPEEVPGTTVDRQCGSSQQAVHFAAQAVMAGVQDVVVAVQPADPFSGSKGWVARYGDQPVSQFHGAELICDKWGITRAEMEDYALESHRRALQAIDEGRFDREVTPYGDVTTDEGPRRDTSLDKLRALKPLAEGGRITAALASQISDGAAALLVASERAVKEHGLRPRARIHQMSVRGADPIYMLTAPIPATAHALDKSGLGLADIDLVEINEAFAPVVLAWQRETGADLAKVNVNGGAIALGHPLGATGAKLMTTLLHELERTGGRYGLQTMCEGGGQANATIIERL